mmetsp:Transcript_7941/g.19783  ORF Transcript_7941/g.19783 Transcript_7941/m.19783 type:complete len:383 (+) Transcript_7941:2996-4144(+)
MGLVRDHDSGLLRKAFQNALLEEILSNVSIHGGQRVVKDVDIRIRVNSARDRDTLPLPATQIVPLVADFGVVPIHKELDIGLECRQMNRSLVHIFVKWFSKEDVLFQRGVENEAGLTRKSNRPAVADDGFPTRQIRLRQDAVQKSALPGARRPQDQRKFTLLHRHIDVRKHVALARLPLRVRLEPRERRVLAVHLDVVRGNIAVLVLRARVDLLGEEKVLNAVEGGGALGEQHERIRQQRERRAQDVEDGNGGEDDGGVEAVSEEDVAREAQHGEHDGDGGDDGGILRGEQVGVLDAVDLCVAHARDLCGEGLFPCVVLDDLDAGDDLGHELDALVGDFQRRVAHLAERGDEGALHGDGDDEEDDAEKGGAEAEEVDEEDAG